MVQRTRVAYWNPLTARSTSQTVDGRQVGRPAARRLQAMGNRSGPSGFPLEPLPLPPGTSRNGAGATPKSRNLLAFCV